MSKKMLIDASRGDETRVVVMVDGRIEEIDHETADRRPIDRKSTRLNSSHSQQSRMPSSA